MKKIFEGERVALLLVVLLTLTLIALPALAQREVGGITGTVTDPSGAVISDASVTAISVEQQTTRSTVTTGTGTYALTHLEPGAYKLTIKKQGFTTVSATVIVAVGQTVGFDAKLKVGTADTVVEVTAGGVTAVNTETATLGQSMTTQQMQEWPSLSRDAYSLVSTAGMVTPDPSNRGTGYAMNGLRSASTNVTLDGAENMDMFTASYSNTVPMDAVREFSVLSSGFTAEFGRASAGMVNVVTKSGTNDIHGSAYEFNRNSALTSTSYQNAATLWDAVHRGVCSGFDDPNCPGRKGVFTRNQPGFSIGGPVIKNKLFFFTNFEWLRVRSNGSRQRWVLTPQFLSALPQNVQAFFTSKGVLRSDLQNTDVLTAAGLQGSVNSTGAFRTWATANPTVPVLQGVAWTVPINLGGGSPQNTLYQISRVDYNVSDRTAFYGRFSLDDENYFASSGLSPYAGYDVATSFFSQNWLASLTHMFSNTIASQSKIAFNRVNNQQPLGSNPAGPTLYMNGSSVPTIAGKRLDFPGYLPEGPGTAIPFGGPQNVYQFNQDLTWTKGSHTFRFGGQYTYLRDNHTFGAYMNAVEDLSSGDPGASFDNLMGGLLYDFQAAIDPQGKYPCKKTINPATGVVTTITDSSCQVTLPVGFPRFSRNNRYNDGAAYVQDAWKVTPRFTLNFGVRWEYYGVQHNADPKLDSNFYLGTGNYSEQLRSGAVMLTGDSPERGLWAPYKKGFGPRVSFAWDVFGNGKTALRGGYGISYERNFGNVTYNVIQNPPNYAVIGLTAADVGGPISITTENAGPLTGTGTKYLPAVTLRNPKQGIKPAYAETWNFSIDRELARDTILTVAYAGSHGIHQYSITNINRLGYGQFLLGDLFPATCTQRDIYYCGTRANLQYSSANQRGDDGFSFYNALNVGFRTTNFKNSGVMITANYTYAHAIDNISNTFGEGTNATNLGLLDPFMPSLDKGNSEFDVRHRLTVSSIWTLPFFEHSSNKVLKNVLGGWELVPSFVARTGMPFTLFDCRNGLNVCPRYMPVAGPVNGSGSSDPTSLYDPATGKNVNRFAYMTFPVNSAGVVQGIGAYGNPALGTARRAAGYSDFPICTGLNHTGCTWPSNMTQRDAFWGPGNWASNLGVYKNFNVTERVKLQVRGELYDVFNHKNFYMDSGTYNLSGVQGGHVNVYKDDYRNVQVGARITF